MCICITPNIFYEYIISHIDPYGHSATGLMNTAHIVDSMCFIMRARCSCKMCKAVKEYRVAMICSKSNGQC